MNKIRVAAYCRVSTDSKDQANSFENQKSYFEREISKNSDYELVEIYADKGISGTKLQRPEFDRMLYDAGLDIRKVPNADNDERKEYIEYEATRSSSREPKFNLILTKNTSRFARNTNVGKVVDILKKNKVYIHFLDLNKTTQNESDITYIKIFQVFDENDSRDKSVKVRFGQQEGVKHGKVLTNNKLYGYKYIKAENRLEIIPEEAEVINTIFNLYSKGMGIRQIVNTLVDRNILTRNRKIFCKSTIRRILDNEKYAGFNNPLKHDTGVVFNKNSYPKVKDHYEVVDSDRIPAIITPELFRQCTDMLKNKVNFKNQKGIYNGTSKYKGLIYCAECGSVFHSNTDHGRIFYNCSNKKLNGLKACDVPNISEKQIDDYIQQLADGLAYDIIDEQSYKSITVIYNVLHYLFDQIDKDKTQEAKIIEQQIEGKQKILDGYEDLYAMQIDNRERLKIKIQNINNDIENLQAQLKEKTKSNNEVIEEITKLYDLSLTAHDLRPNKTAFTIDEVLQMIDKIYILNDRVHHKPYTNAILLIEDQIEKLVQKYKDITEFKPLTSEEINWIHEKLETVIEFV